LTHATIEEIEAEKSVIEEQAVSNCRLYLKGPFVWSGFVPLVLTSCSYVFSERKDGEGNRNGPN